MIWESDCLDFLDSLGRSISHWPPGQVLSPDELVYRGCDVADGSYLQFPLNSPITDANDQSVCPPR